MARFSVGDLVFFGRPKGEQTPGKVITVRLKELRIKALQPRGRKCQKPTGTIWTVSTSICTKIDPNAKPKPSDITIVMGDGHIAKLGDWVCFNNPQYGMIFGMIQKINTQTAVIVNCTDTSPACTIRRHDLRRPPVNRSKQAVLQDIVAVYAALSTHHPDPKREAALHHWLNNLKDEYGSYINQLDAIDLFTQDVT